MKKLIITCALIGSASVASFAQSQQPPVQPTTPPANAAGAQPMPRQMPSPEMIAERRAKMYEKQLTLTPEQYKGVYDAELNFTKQMMAARTSGKPGDPAQRKQMMETKDEAFKKVLTPEQYTKYSASARPMPAPPPAPNTSTPTPAK